MERLSLMLCWTIVFVCYKVDQQTWLWEAFDSNMRALLEFVVEFICSFGKWGSGLLLEKISLFKAELHISGLDSWDVGSLKQKAIRWNFLFCSSMLMGGCRVWYVPVDGSMLGLGFFFSFVVSTHTPTYDTRQLPHHLCYNLGSLVVFCRFVQIFLALWAQEKNFEDFFLGHLVVETGYPITLHLLTG